MLGLTGWQRSHCGARPMELARSLTSGVLGKPVPEEEVSCQSRSTMKQVEKGMEGRIVLGEAAICHMVLEACREPDLSPDLWSKHW